MASAGQEAAILFEKIQRTAILVDPIGFFRMRLLGIAACTDLLESLLDFRYGVQWRNAASGRHDN